MLICNMCKELLDNKKVTFTLFGGRQIDLCENCDKKVYEFINGMVRVKPKP